MKKIAVFRFLLTALLCISLAACGGQGGEAGSSENTVGTDQGRTGDTAVGAGQGQPGETAAPVPARVPAQSSSEKKDILSEVEQVFDAKFDSFADDPDADTENYGRVLGAQFYQGEPVLLWMKNWEREVSVPHTEEDGTVTRIKEVRAVEDGGLYLLRMDGNRELLIPAGNFLRENFWIKKNNARSQQYSFVLDDKGNCFARTNYKDGNERDYFLLIGRDGEIVYKSVIEEGYYAKDFCDSPDGRSFAVLERSIPVNNKTVTRLVEFDSETGMLSQTDAFRLERERIAPVIGEGPDGFYYYIPAGYKKIQEDGSSEDYMLFQGTSYARWTSESGWSSKDFRVLVDGSIEILEAKNFADGSYKAVIERLWLSGSDKIPVAVRARAVSSWLKSQAALFNRTNDTYQIVLEEFSNGNSGELEEYARLTSVELATGKGPDILYGDFMADYICGMIDKGALLELGPYLQKSGLREEDYLPIAFGGLRDGDKIYSVQADASPDVYKIKSEVLGEIGNPARISIGMLMDALAERKGNETFYALYESGDLLRMFLKGSENLWGMVDWEAGTCDFRGELFAKIMENARRYGYDGRRKYPNLVQSASYATLFRYDSLKELEGEGMTRLGVLFDGGCYGATGLESAMMINANSQQKEGAWEFIAFLLKEEAQMELSINFPVNRSVLPVWVRKKVQDTFSNSLTVSVGSVYIDEGEVIRKYREYTQEAMTEERIAEYMDALEEVRSLPFRTAPILDIICEEAESYFNGSKSIGDVSGVIENRVRLYLEERKRN